MSVLSYLPRIRGLLPASLFAVVSSSVDLANTHAAATRTESLPPTPNAAAQEGMYQVPYNGTFTFTRIRYNAVGFGLGGRGGLRGFGMGNAWIHDYPRADQNMERMIAETTYMRANTDGSNVLDLEDARIFQYPIIYMSEPGYWSITKEGSDNLRQYLLKGGFLIFDDFEADQWYNMAEQLETALPEHKWFEITETHPIFYTFFRLLDIYVPHPTVRVTPNYQAIFEDNDPTKRIMVLANHNSDLAEYWEWTGLNQFGLAPTNDAYRLGINYILYAMIH